MNTCNHRLRLTITASVLLAMSLPARVVDRYAIDVAPDNTPQYLLINVRKIAREVLDEIHTKIPAAQDGDTLSAGFPQRRDTIAYTG